MVKDGDAAAAARIVGVATLVLAFVAAAVLRETYQRELDYHER